MKTTAVAALTVLVLAGCKGGTPRPPPTTPATPPSSAAAGTSTSVGATTTSSAASVQEIRITVAGSQVTGGGRHRLRRGQAIRIVVTADVSDEVHLHGYDEKAHVTPTAPAIIELVVDVPGVFEVELESKGRRLAELEVAG